MLIPPDTAERFIHAYKEMLTAVAGRSLRAVAEYVEARNTFFEDQALLKKPPTQDPDLLSALETASFGKFAVGRHLVRWTEMVGPANQVYRVKGGTTELREIIEPWTLIQTAVMQFQGHWICDGLINSFNVHIGSGMRKGLMERIRGH